MPFKFVIERVMEPEKLIPHLFEETAPGFHEQAKPGDIIVAGRNFAKGKAHVQGLIAMQAMGLGLVCESMPFNSYRAAVSQGLLLMNGCSGVTNLVEDGDSLEIDFHTGDFTNHTRGVHKTYSPLPESLQEMIALGGTKGMLRHWWESHQSTANSS